MNSNRTSQPGSGTRNHEFAVELVGKVALVTGASRGIGRTLALALAGAGADVAVNYHTHAEEAHAVCSEIEHRGGRAFAVQANVSNAAEVVRMVESVQRHLGGIDILVNNAGISRPQPLDEMTERASGLLIPGRERRGAVEVD